MTNLGSPAGMGRALAEHGVLDLDGPASRQNEHHRDAAGPDGKEAFMELICIGVTIAFVAATWALIALCDRLQGDGR